LGPGHYRFEVQAALTDDFSGGSAASYDFVIQMPLQRRWWFWLGLGLLAVTTVILILRRREAAIRHVARLQRERLNFEYEHLKSQVNPHFLFNSLNTLVQLIEEDRDAAAEYTVRLSDFYRETLSFRDRDLVTLAEEWTVVNKYVFIQKGRFGAALEVQMDVPAARQAAIRVVPLVLQLLVENAVKHNVVAQSQPLVIRIYEADEQLVVSNPVRPRRTAEKGAGLGLHNIRSRYALLTNRPVHIESEAAQFRVILPLL
jgi:LytS/YehU family sensor histidine kinase